jgi:outer membrane protein TolC
MTFFKKLNLSISAICLVWSPIAAAESAPASATSLSLANAISQAETNSPDLKRLRAAAQRISWTKTEALSGYMPHLSANYDHFLNSDYMREDVVFGGAVVDFPAAYPQDNITLDASITLFDGFESLHKYRAAEFNTDAANLEVNRAQFKVEEAVRLAFFQALAAQKLFEVAQQNVNTLEDHLDRAHVTEHAGYGTQFDVLRIEATLEEARAEQEEAENNIQITRDALREVMGVEGDDVRSLVGELPVLKESDIPKDLTASSIDRDDLKAQMKRDAASQEIMSASRGFWYPSVSLFAEEEYYKFGTFDPAIQSNSGYQNASGVGIRLKWNLFDGGYSYARQQQATQAAVEAQSETHKALTKLPQEFDTWKRKFYHSTSLYRARMRALAQYQESVRLAAIGVKAGSRTHTEMLDAELDLFRARGGLVKAQADAIECLGNLELAVGRKLWDASTSPQ